MIGEPKTGELEGAVLSGVAHEGLTVRTADGRPARLAIVDEHGRIVAEGDPVAREAWAVAIAAYRNFLKGVGHLRVRSGPPEGEA